MTEERRCGADGCETPVEGEKVFCDPHYAFLSQETKEHLLAAWGTDDWPTEVERACCELRRLRPRRSR